MKLTEFTFFKDTPLIDFQNTIHFTSNTARDNHFLNGNHYEKLSIQGGSFNFVRQRSTIDITANFDEFRGVNYCTFLSDFEPNTRYYAYVMEYEYLNDNTIRVYLLIDSIMTHTQGNVLNNLVNLNITRQHLTRTNYNKRLWELKNNGDILKAHTKSYFHTDRILFNDLVVLIQSGADLRSDFGDVDNPKIKSSIGNVFDGITSPLDMYVCSLTDFTKLMKKLRDYPWITQNFKSLSIIPKTFMEGNLTKIIFAPTAETLGGVDYLYYISGGKTNATNLRNEISQVSYNMSELLTLYGLDVNEDKHLLRNEYTTTELYNYSGGQLFIDNGLLPPNRGLIYDVDLITGYHTEIKVYVSNYRMGEGITYKGGSYVNDSLTFDTFDDIPMIINNESLSLAKSANRRALTESKLLTNRVSNVLDPKADIKDRFMDAANLISGFSMSSMFGKFSDEHEYYRTQKAEQADLALETPTITNQSNGNAFNIANDMFGIHFKYSKPNQTEMNRIRKYYKVMGFQTDDYSSKLDDVHSMTMLNYVQFSGSWSVPNVDVALIEMMKAQFENGVRLWHSNGTGNPMGQDVLLNKMR